MCVNLNYTRSIVSYTASTNNRQSLDMFRALYTSPFLVDMFKISHIPVII